MCGGWYEGGDAGVVEQGLASNCQCAHVTTLEHMVNNLNEEAHPHW
jgi:hypothetical protein